jgi:hypothetical protein
MKPRAPGSQFCAEHTRGNAAHKKGDSSDAATGFVGLLVVVVVVGGLFWACSSMGDDEDPSPAAPAYEDETKGDASARLACGHFYNVLGDVRDGVLTDFELREKLREIHDTARVSETPGIASSAQAMLAAATTGTSSDVLDAASRMVDACEDVDPL